MSKLFDGSYRSRPAVSLRGQSKREDSKEDLVIKAQLVRAPLPPAAAAAKHTPPCEP